jgi:hypothetical protein
MATSELALEWRRHPSFVRPESGLRLLQGGQGGRNRLVSAWPRAEHGRDAVYAVLRNHAPMWDTPERIALYARVPLELAERALDALRDEGRALQDRNMWRAEGMGFGEPAP